MALLLFPNGDWQPAWTRHIAGAIAAVFLIGIVEATGLVASRTFLPLAIPCVLAALASLLWRYRRLAGAEEKQQLKWAAFGLVAGIALILAARTGGLVAPAIHAIVWEGLFQLGIVVIALGFLTSLLRYRLYDAETAISQSAVYAALTLALVATFAASEALIELLSQQYLGSGFGNISGAMAAAIAAAMLAPLHGRISGWAEHYFQRDLLVLKRDLPELLADLSGAASAADLGQAVLPRIAQAIHATRAALIVGDTAVAVDGSDLDRARQWALHRRPPIAGQPFDRDPDDTDFPLRMALACPVGGVIGWLVLGPRPDGSLYGKDDIEALSAVGTPLRRVLVAILSRQRDREAARDRHRRLQRHLDRLDDAVSALRHGKVPFTGRD